MDRAVIYARFSSDMQREESIDAQVRACKEYCKRKGYIVVNVYSDEAKSGRSILERTAYNQMLADAISDAFDVIIFHKIDRNSRNEFNYYTFKDGRLYITNENSWTDRKYLHPIPKAALVKNPNLKQNYGWEQ